MQSLPVQQWTILRACKQMIWICRVEVNFPHCAWNKEKVQWRDHQSASCKKRLKTKTIKSSSGESYFQRNEPPWVRRARCLVLRPIHTACHPAPLWPQCAAGWGVCLHSAEGRDPQILKKGNKKKWTTARFFLNQYYKNHCLKRGKAILQGENLWWRVALLS